MRQSDAGKATFSCLVRNDNLEVSRVCFQSSDTIWIAPSPDPELVELYCLICGELEVWNNERRDSLLPGDCLYALQLENDVRIRAVTDSVMLTVSNRAVVSDAQSFADEMNAILRSIDEKDSITLIHSQNVMSYAVRLYDCLSVKPGELRMDDLVTAALFHDVGKCNTPDEVLKKVGPLTSGEYEIMKRHPSDSYGILLPVYGETVARIVRSHHERLDGSGYPDGLRGDMIPFGAKLIAVADSFEAMTHKRLYNRIKTQAEAAQELASMTDKYDAGIVSLLRRMVENGELTRDGEAADAALR